VTCSRTGYTRCTRAPWT